MTSFILIKYYRTFLFSSKSKCSLGSCESLRIGSLERDNYHVGTTGMHLAELLTRFHRCTGSVERTGSSRCAELVASLSATAGAEKSDD